MPRRIFIWAAIVSLCLDQISKVLAYGMLTEHISYRLIGNLVRLSLTTNSQGLFGMSYGPPVIYFILPVLGIGLVLYFALRTRDKWLTIAYGLVLGGAVGNLVDRVRLAGRVIDFIDIGVRGWRWYTFNLADLWVVVGVILLLFREFFGPRAKPQSTTDRPAPDGLKDETVKSVESADGTGQ